MRFGTRIGLFTAATMACGVCAASAMADIMYVSQQRFVEASTFPGGAFMRQDAPDFGPFIGDVSVESQGTISSSGSARQTSTLGSNDIQAMGLVVGQSTQGGYGGGRTECAVSFDIVSPTNFSLEGFVCRSEGQSGGIVFSGPQGDIVRREIIFFDDPFSISLLGANRIQGVLVPGRYSLQFYSQAFGSSFSGANASYEVSLSVPTPSAAISFLLLSMYCMNRKRRCTMS